MKRYVPIHSDLYGSFARALFYVLAARAAFTTVQVQQTSQDDTDVPPPTRSAKPEPPAVATDTAWSMLTSATGDLKHPQLGRYLLSSGAVVAAPAAASIVRKKH